MDSGTFLDRIEALPTWLLNRAASRGRDAVTGGLAGVGLRMPHHAILAALADMTAEPDAAPVTQADLVRRTGFDPKDVVGLVNDLERRGLATRAAHPSDRRKNALRVTDDGRVMLVRLIDIGEDANAHLLAPLTTAERAEFVRLLRLVVEGGVSPVAG